MGLIKLNRPTPLILKQFLMGLKGFIGVISGAAIFVEKPYYAVAFLAAGGMIDLFINLFTGENPIITFERAANDAGIPLVVMQKTEDAQNG